MTIVESCSQQHSIHPTTSDLAPLLTLSIVNSATIISLLQHVSPEIFHLYHTHGAGRHATPDSTIAHTRHDACHVYPADARSKRSVTVTRCSPVSTAQRSAVRREGQACETRTKKG